MHVYFKKCDFSILNSRNIFVFYDNYYYKISVGINTIQNTVKLNIMFFIQH